MTNLLKRRLALLASEQARPLLQQGLRGIERETLRVTADGRLATTPHPPALGSALTHPQITTDYSEALLEFITPAEHDIATALTQLDAIHRYATSMLGQELLWSQSMPVPLPAEEEIPIAWYGTSHIGMIKHVYRRGLALRYGRAMQCIAGIHYNYSLAESLWPLLQQEEGASGCLRDYQSESYIALVRNFYRTNWLLMLLFGAAPALDAGFMRGHEHQLQRLSDDTLYLPYATSLRMSDLGYQNNVQAGLVPPYNTLPEYMRSLARAVRQPHAPYVQMGTRRDGEWVQINTNVLQIENEFYASIRPKRVIASGERPLEALCARGVQYIEVRCMDVDPFSPVGISLQTARFLDVYLLYCTLEQSAPTNHAEGVENAANFALAVKEGRRPGLTLQRNGVATPIAAWGRELLDEMEAVAALLDAQHGGTEHADALRAQRAKLADLDTTPSAQALEAIRRHGSFAAFGMAQSRLHAENFRSRPLTQEQQQAFAAMAETSLAEQATMEATQSGSFDDFIRQYQDRTPAQLCEQPCTQ
ncbi:MAG TPA: glutamate--cysteine ligase [Noviherbaspirillum sp.]